MTAPQSPQPTVDASDAVGERDELARAIDPDVFDETVKKSARDIAVLQWAIRRKRAFDAADAVLASPALACRDDRMRREGAAGVVEAVRALGPTWHRGMYGAPDDMFSRRFLDAALAPFTQGDES